MKKIIVYTFSLFYSLLGCTQVPAVRPPIVNPAFDQKLSRTISFTVPTMGVKELQETKETVYILDAREKAEFEVSHIPNAQFIGYKKLDIAVLDDIPKDAKVVLYCSIGYRSEKVGEKLQKKGFTNVHNLYGSIFEWANQGYPLVDAKGAPTPKIHTYNKRWSQWVQNEKAVKVW